MISISFTHTGVTSVANEAGERPGRSSCSQRPHDKNGGMTLMLLPERAPSECARSTAAVGATRVPFQERELASLEG